MQSDPGTGILHEARSSVLWICISTTAVLQMKLTPVAISR